MQKNPNLLLVVDRITKALLLLLFACSQSLVKFWSQIKVETYILYITYFFFFIKELNLSIQHSINNVNKYKYKLYFDNWLET